MLECSATLENAEADPPQAGREADGPQGLATGKAGIADFLDALRDGEGFQMDAIAKGFRSEDVCGRRVGFFDVWQNGDWESMGVGYG